MKIIPVILSGGSGNRLWPLSRQEYPKQYLPLTGDKSMLQETILRLNGLGCLADPIIICNNDHRFLVAEQCNQINIKNPTILLEPVGRNTAPAIIAAAIKSIEEKEEAVLFVLSADHVIKDVKSFHKAINIAINQAKEDKLVIFGVIPTEANSEYGYIKTSKYDINDAYKVEEFVEKPDLKTAQIYLDRGSYLWNSGMFMFKNNILISELTLHSPDIVNLVSSAVKNATQDIDFIRLEKNAFESSPSDSIDYALMEKSTNTVVIPLDVGWSDVGSWSTLYDVCLKDSSGNVLNGDVIVKDTTNTYIYASKHIVTAVGLDNLVVIDTSDATFIASKDKAHEVKSIVKSLKKKGRDEAHSNRKVYRPWGWYDSIDAGRNFQVKRLHVNPGAKLSLQMHKKRAEHWVIIKGVATVVNGKATLSLKEGESSYIPVGIKHSLENNTNEELEVIEVQSGVYLGEDDIFRFEDIYGRVKE
jgi:mannose-1-phosphate guanylyltransferase/mannose-6-phosphate isomerase